MTQLSVVIAGLPRTVGIRFVDRFGWKQNNARVVAYPALETRAYTAGYADKLYTRLADHLRVRHDGNWHERWQLTLILLYVQKKDGSEQHLFDRFRLESMMLPLNCEGLRDAKATRVNRIVRELVAESEGLLAKGRALVRAVQEEINNRQNKTCLLLPCKNFGHDFHSVLSSVESAGAEGDTVDQFRRRLASVAERLPKRDRYFEGNRSIVFRVPPKAGPRHGLAPVWDSGEHKDSCVIRGRVRFGAPYDPNFHYDCTLPSHASRQFESCHGNHVTLRGREHANIAPNDNVR